MLCVKRDSKPTISLDAFVFLPPPQHCSSYDFGYLVRLLTSQKLPDEEGDFFELMSIHFPRVYDVKYLMKSCKNLKGGLQEVAESLQVSGLGT